MDIKAKIFMVVFFVSILVFVLHVYHRWSKSNAEHRIRVIVQNSRPENLNDSRFIFTSGPDPPSIPQGQLNPSILASLPVLDYAAGAQLIECAVCLSEFEVGEKIRLLPKCNHSFHIDCIDMWFHSHATCPLCRSQVEQFCAGLGATWRMPFLGMGTRSTVFSPEAGESTSPDLPELDLESQLGQSTQT